MRRRPNRRTPDKSDPVDRNRLSIVRACLSASVFIYLGLAALAARWLPDEPFIAIVLILFAAHTSAYFLFKEVRG